MLCYLEQKVNRSMRNVHIVSSMLVAFGLSILNVGCEPAKRPESKGTTTAEGVQTKAGPGTTAGSVKINSGPGSTTGGGVELPTSSVGGTNEVAPPSQKK